MIPDLSSFFADLRKQATPTAGHDELIQTELDDDTLRNVLRLFSAPRAAAVHPCIALPTIATGFAIRSFLDKFAFETTKGDVDKDIATAAMKDPWGYFRFSATVNDSYTAQASLRHMTRQHLGDPNFWPWVHELPHDWRLAFLVAVFDTATPQVKKTATIIALQASPSILSTRFASELAGLQPSFEQKARDLIRQTLESSSGHLNALKRKAEEEAGQSGSDKKPKAEAVKADGSAS